MERINPVNAIDYMDQKPIEADYIASRYNEYLARAAHYHYLAGIEKDPKEKEWSRTRESVNYIVACQYGSLLGHTEGEAGDLLENTIKAIERAADAGKPYRLPGDTIAYYPDGTSILLHWSER